MTKFIDLGSQLIKNKGKWRNRVVIGTPVTGLVRVEWMLARYGQLIPTNWSMADILQWMPTTAPLQYLVSDAQNLIVRSAIQQDTEWLFLVEQDNILPPNTFWRLNEYMRKAEIPVISGLYFTKSNPPEPMIYRRPGWGYYGNWKMGDKVWCSGVPTGCLLIHMSILRKMWDESPEYKVGNEVTRRVFAEPSKIWFDPERGTMVSSSGTSDLAWCERVMKEGFFEKAGWPKYAKMKYPFMVDTNMMIFHIDNEGRQYPLEIPLEFKPVPKNEKKAKSKSKK